MNQREAFEKWASNPPMEFCLARHDDTAAWPGNYKDYHVECAWQAWQAATAIERESCAKIAEQTVCDTHIPTGVKIYGTRAAKNIRDRP